MHDPNAVGVQEDLRPILLRRMKEDVENLPEKEEVVVWVQLTHQQRTYYKALYSNQVQPLAHMSCGSALVGSVMPRVSLKGFDGVDFCPFLPTYEFYPDLPPPSPPPSIPQEGYQQMLSQTSPQSCLLPLPLPSGVPPLAMHTL